MRTLAMITALTVAATAANSSVAQQGAAHDGYSQLLALFADWRAFEPPAIRAGAPDYSAATLAKKQAQLKTYQSRLAALQPSSWPVEQQVDYHLVRAEMNGLDFNLRVLQPWARDPAYYTTLWTAQSDTPAHEGPTNHAIIELWTYSFPLSQQAESKLARELQVIPPLLSQARTNLVGNARDLWVTGTGTMKQQVSDLSDLEKKTANSGRALKRAIDEARKATTEFVAWLEHQAPSKSGPSGVGKENYTWSQRNVHLVPLSWEAEEMLLKRELARAHAALHLEEQRNHGLPELDPISSAEEFQRRGNDAVTKLMDFVQRKQLLAVQANMDPAIRAKIGEFVPPATRNFFAIAEHYEPLTLYTHFYHWWDLARMRDSPHPSPVRRGPLLFNIWDNRAEGMATAFEEMTLHAGLYDDNPRAREIVWIMLAQRAARGLASLYAQANEFDIAKAKAFQVEWTPRGWMRPDLDLLGFEQQLYLRQPGYGTSYVTGKYLLDQLMKDRSHQLDKEFSTSRYFEEVNGAGLIPVAMIRWQLTGLDDDVKALDR